MLFSDTFLTVEEFAEGVYREKGSKFLAVLMPVRSEAAIKENLANLRKQYYDATHCCYAYFLGADRLIFRADDDGEPSGTAGRPILNQLKSKQLTNVLLAVVRYYGGTKLGAAGLANAYKTAAADALANAKIIEEIVKERFVIHFNYLQMNDIMKIVKDHQLDVLAQNFDNECALSVAIRQNDIETIKSKLKHLENVRLTNE